MYILFEFVIKASFDSYLGHISYFRSLDVNTLIGNVGGYVGLLIGVSISDLPVLIKRIAQESQQVIEVGKIIFQSKSNLNGLQ